ncbi:MAG: type II secretion system F family protein [Thermoguttaceae bacterium]|jgi:type IV pilus assembly protein PilC|nr:type II secretion system F family protein [Thermoguttaceae bacterium]
MPLEDWCLAHARTSAKQHSRITLDDKMAFFQQLSTLVVSGTPLLAALQMAAEQSQSTRMRAVLNEIAERVAGGGSLYSVLGDYRGIFEDHWIEVIGTGEVSGKMGMVLCELNQQIRESREARRKVTGALIYPIVLLVVAVGVVVTMLWFVVPTFAAMFREMNAKLPTITEYVLKASDFIVANGLYLVGAVVALVVAVRYYLRREEGLRRVLAMGISLPLFGDLIIQSAMYRFASNLALLLKSGVPMLETLSAMSTVFRGNPIYRDAMLEVHRRVATGHPLADSLVDTRLFTTMMTNMVRIGEESSQLAPVMEQIAPYYKEKMHSFLAKVTKLMEPAIIIVMGGTIAGLMLAIYLPMFEMAGAVK